jgi:lipopolysaccharide export system permease protein
MLGHTIHRTIFWELLRVFSLTLTGLTGLFLIGLVIQQASQMGLTLLQTLAALPLLVPYTLPYTIPATTLFASCVVYGRLSHDNEAVALKAAGVNLYTILRPAITLGLLASLATFGLAHSVIPRTQTELQKQILRDPEELLYTALKRERVFRAANFPYVIHVRDVQNRRLVDVVLKKKEVLRDPINGKETTTQNYEFTLRAREARLRVVLPTGANPDEKPMLFIDPDRWVGVDPTGARIEMDANRPVGVPLPEMFSQKEIGERPMNLDWPDLPPKAAQFRLELEKAEQQIADNRKLQDAATDPALKKFFDQNGTNLEYLRKHWQRQILNVENEYYMRPALSLGCLVFALIGCPVGMWANRADYLSSFVTCFLPTVFAYYPLLLAGSNMGRDGKVPLPLGVFFADAVTGLIAVILAVRLIKR